MIKAQNQECGSLVGSVLNSVPVMLFGASSKQEFSSLNFNLGRNSRVHPLLQGCVMF